MFNIAASRSTVAREILGGLTTFMAMSYIIFVQMGLLSSLGMDRGGVMMATCIAAGVTCILMGLLANYPVALAPGMGENFFFAGIAAMMATWGAGAAGWQMALALTAVAGALFLALSLVGFRSRVLNAIPDALKSGIAAGIGLFIATIGFSYGNLVQSGGALVSFPGLAHNPIAWLALIGLAITLALLAFRVPGAILLGILATTGLAMLMGQVKLSGGWLIGWPHGLEKTAGGVVPGFAAAWGALFSPHALQIVVTIFILFFMMLFDTVGTLVAVASRGGLMVNGKLPRAERALATDAAGTVLGAALGTSTITTYIESITGVSVGARTGLAAIVAGVLMLLAMFFQPLAEVIGGGIQLLDPAGQPVRLPNGAPVIKYPMIAPALIVVGAMMLRAIRDIDWDDATEYLPAFLTVIFTVLAFSIADGIAIGFVSYAFGKLVTGRVRQCPLIVYIFAALFVVRYAVEALYMH